MFPIKSPKLIFTFISFFSFCLSALESEGQYVPAQHRIPAAGEIPVSESGSYGIPGATYVLVNDIKDIKSTLFLGKDITLDLNGYTVTYADGNYGHVLNYGFEEGLTGWDISKAPGARIENTEEVHTFIGDRLLRMKAGDEITSSYIYLPVAGRSYFAMCGVTGNYYNEMGGDLNKDMRVSIYVDDEQGNEIRCITTYGDSTRVSCPIINRSTRLGGGFIFAHLNKLPAGKYRIRVKAENECLVDEIDIRPAMDVGIGIVEKTHPMGHYDHLYNRNHSAFFDYTADVSSGKPFKGIPVAEGAGTVTIKNGIIRNATIGILSWGIQSTARNVRIIMDNLKIISSGINTIAVDVPQASITNCTFDIRSPFIINRHGSEFYAVDLQGEQASEVSFCEFYGGQGCLCFKGKFSAIHHNYFVNRQTVTNHYSVMAMGDGSKIFENRFEPEIGSGIEIFRHRNIDIFNNEFHIKAAPPSCEYNDHYSTNAIRIADYGAATGSPEGSYGNRIYNNKFYITGRKFEKYPDYIPMASAFFYSASAGDNEIFGNGIIINQDNPGTDAEAFAFYIGNARGGRIYNNNIIANVTPIWVACSYGRAEHTKLTGNSITRAEYTVRNFKPVRMGSLEQPDYIAVGTEFRSNELTGLEFVVDETDQHHSYSVFWILKINLYDQKSRVLSGTEIKIMDRNGKEIVSQRTDNYGSLRVELPEYFADGNEKTVSTPYTIIVGKKKIVIELKKNSEIDMVVEGSVPK
ncbi:MAG: hypothetical protein A2X06_02925 [Bacteroidetes bacterium GWC2_40_22]|nr:MAG: hypothetical protein A2X06_02925 [Bacteroidetes bacterium GWC2_40_22]